MAGIAVSVRSIRGGVFFGLPCLYAVSGEGCSLDCRRRMQSGKSPERSAHGILTSCALWTAILLPRGRRYYLSEDDHDIVYSDFRV